MLEKLELQIEPALKNEALGDVQSLMAFCDPNIEHVDYSRAQDGVLTIEFHSGPSAEEIERKTRNIIGKAVAKGPLAPTKVRDRIEQGVSWDSDFDAQLEASGLAIELGEGNVGLRGPVAELWRIFDEDFRKLSVDLGAEEAKYPGMIDVEFLKRIGYFKSFPHYTTYVTHLPPDVEVLDKFINKVLAVGDSAEVPTEHLVACPKVQSPTICYHFYQALEGTTVPDEGLLVTAQGPCCRWESSALDGMKRLWEFSMRELIIAGEKDFVLQNRDRALEAVLNYCRELKLEAWIENASDFFFSDDSASKSTYQKGFGMKWELRIPYNAKKKSVAAASFNFMQDTFGKSCNLTLADGSPCFSGCIGWGIERWIYAFLAQHGLETEFWPQQIRERLNDAS